MALRLNVMSGHILRDTNDALSKVIATVQAGNGIGRLLDAFKDVFTVSNRPRSHPFGQRPQCLGISFGVVENKAPSAVEIGRSRSTILR